MTSFRDMTESDVIARNLRVRQARSAPQAPPQEKKELNTLPALPSDAGKGQKRRSNGYATGTPGRQPHRKYRNQPCVVEGHKFASRHEAREYAKLRLRQHGGQIEDLQLQVRFPLHVNGVQVAVYVSDFCYQEHGQLVVADAKGVKTPIYKLKKKMMAAEYGITILEL